MESVRLSTLSKQKEELERVFTLQARQSKSMSTLQEAFSQLQQDSLQTASSQKLLQANFATVSAQVEQLVAKVERINEEAVQMPTFDYYQAQTKASFEQLNSDLDSK